MKPGLPETADILHRVRQQLILAQVRIMELEDSRDGFSGKLDDVEKLLTDAQRLADAKADEAGHLAKVRDELQAQFEHMRHMQHVTNEALNQTRSQLAAAEKDRERLQQKIIALVDQATQLNQSIGRFRDDLAESQRVGATRLERISALEGEISGMKATRSWRWTRWFRPREGASGEKRP